MKNFLIALILAIAVPIDKSSYAQDTIIYLLRHAERAEDGTDDPNLSELGAQRAKTFSQLFHGENITHIFSSPYKRTIISAEPTAQDHGLNIEEYDPSDLPSLARKLKELEGSILIFGHSNTTPALVNLLAGTNLENLDERIYDRVYIVTSNDEGETELRVEYTEPRTPF